MIGKKVMRAFVSSQLKNIKSSNLYSTCTAISINKIETNANPMTAFMLLNNNNANFKINQNKKQHQLSNKMSFSTHNPSSSPSGSEILASFNETKRSNFEGNDVDGAMYALANADAVCFDVDSTVIEEEGIDVLADSLGKGKEVADFTAKAMGGSMKFEEALAARLELMKPSRSSVLDCLESHPIRLSPGIDRLIKTLHLHGKDVYLVSGGFRMMIEPIAKELMVSKTNIYANTILFDENDGNTYKGFDANEPTSADGGKPKALSIIKDKFGYDKMVMVGDGATDAQAKPPADSFIGFGGVVVRDAVKDKACWFVYDFEDMISVVDNFGTQRESTN